LHIAECQHCVFLYQQINTIVQSLGSEKIQENDFYFYARLKHRMENKHSPKNLINYLPKKVLQPAVVFCLLAIGIFMGINIGNLYNTPSAIMSADEVRTSQLNAYSEETYIAEINNEKMESLFTSNQ